MGSLVNVLFLCLPNLAAFSCNQQSFKANKQLECVTQNFSNRGYFTNRWHSSSLNNTRKFFEIWRRGRKTIFSNFRSDFEGLELSLSEQFDCKRNNWIWIFFIDHKNLLRNLFDLFITIWVCESKKKSKKKHSSEQLISIVKVGRTIQCDLKCTLCIFNNALLTEFGIYKLFFLHVIIVLTAKMAFYRLSWLRFYFLLFLLWQERQKW